MNVRIIGAGVAGLTCALAFSNRGCTVEIVESRDAVGRGCSWYAGGMLAPWCERESAEPLVVALGVESLAFWQANFPGMRSNGSLVVAPARDQPDLKRFARRTGEYEWVGADAIAELEPDLAGRFSQALYFPREAHINPREALAALRSRLEARMGVAFRFGTVTAEPSLKADWTVDCRGLAARDALPDLRGVKGEMLLLRTREVVLSRPVRMLHPRIPVYIVPRADGHFMVGATSVETDEPSRITARAMMELLSAAFTLHPAFGEAEVVETGTGVRPAFPDNLPRLRRRGRTLWVNGLYRHGFLLAPAMARMAAAVALDGAVFPEVMREAMQEEVMHDGQDQRRSA